MSRGLAWGLLLTALVLFVAYFLFWLIETPSVLVVRMPDDAFYYLKIARNFASGKGLTFDGINPTNGFQPLWLLLLLLPASLGKTLSAEAFHRLAMVYQIALFGLGLILLNSALASRLSPLSRALMNALALAIGITVLLRGMEPAVIWLTFCVMVFWLAHTANYSDALAWKWLVTGALLGLVCLARLDMVFFVSIYTGHLLWNARQLPYRILVRNSAFLLFGFALLIAPYLLYNAIQFGDVIPISGRLKSAFPQIAILSSSGMPPIPALATLAMAVGLLVSLWLWRHASKPDAISRFLFYWCIGSVLHWWHTVLFMKWGVLISHFASYWIPLVALLPRLLQEAEKHRLRWLWGLGTGCTVALILWACQDVHACFRIKHTSPVHWRTSMYHAALWAKHHTPPNAIFGMTDSGIFGYYSERRVINLDGVVNNREYQRYLLHRQLKHYFRRQGIEYLVVYVVPDSPRFPTPSQEGNRCSDVYRGQYREFRFCYYARLYGDVPSDEISLYRENEVYRERHLKGMLIIWRVAP